MMEDLKAIGFDQSSIYQYHPGLLWFVIPQRITGLPVLSVMEIKPSPLTDTYNSNIIIANVPCQTENNLINILQRFSVIAQ